MLCTCILASRCCCKWKLRTGVIAITILTLVVCLIWMAVLIWDIKSVLDSKEDGAVKRVILPCILVALVGLWAISALFMSVALCFGNRRLLIPWLIMTIVIGVIDTIFLIVAIVQITEAHNKKSAINAIVLSALQVFMMLFFIYCFIIVISYYFYNMKEPKAWDEGYGQRKPVYTGTDKPAEPAGEAKPTEPLTAETVTTVGVEERVEPEEHVRF